MSDHDSAICPICESVFEKNVHNQKYCDTDCKRESENRQRRKDYTYDVADAVAKTVAPAYLHIEDADERIDFLVRENQRLHRLAEKHKHSKLEVVDAVYRAAQDTFSQLPMPEVNPPVSFGKSGEEEVAVAVCADWQLGKQTPSYSSDVCAERIALFTEKVIHITKIQRSDHPVKEIRIWFLGDIVEGEEIFSGQSHLIDASLYNQVGVKGPAVIRNMILRFLEEFETVHIAGIIGNHGRIGGARSRDYNGETNMDRLLYKIVYWMFEDNPRVSFNIPDGHGERNFWAVETIGNYGTLLMHGDQFPAPSSTHTYYKKVMGWKDGAIPEKFDDVYIGHYHQNTKMTLGSSILRISGSPESYNTFAQEVLAVMGRPSQNLQFVHPRRGVTGEYTVWLDEI